MSTRKNPAKPVEPRSAPHPAVRHRKIRSLLTRPLGLLGWERLEPVLLAALTTREPLLLIGRHGTAKSFLLERLAQAVASRATEPQRAAIALVLYLALRSSRRIAATAAETLASQLSRVLHPFTTTHKVYGKELQNCREVASLCSGLENTFRDKYARNLLNAFLPDGYAEITPQELHAEFIGLWERFRVTISGAKNGS
jgi:hypothetical protein